MSRTGRAPATIPLFMDASIQATSRQEPRPSVLRSPRRLLLAAAGVVCVGLGALGVFVPGLPTTVFLIVASYLFTRSCPWLEERLLHNRLFRPYLRYLEGEARMPLRAKVVTIAVMWAFVAVSAWLLAARFGERPWIPLLPPGAAVVGTFFIATLGRGEDTADRR